MKNLTLGTSQTYTNDHIYNMTSERIKEIQQVTAYPESRSVHQALLQVWNECEQEKKMYSEEDMILYSDYVLMCSAEKTFKLPLKPKEWFEQFKNK